MTDTPKPKTLDELLDASAATAEFKAAVRELAAGRAADRIAMNAGAPLIKVLRVVMKLLEAQPRAPIERVSVQGMSGCSNFTGSLAAEPGALRVDFNWDCRWRAHQLGWLDGFGDIDQIRAARELGYQCFEKFEVKTSTPDSIENKPAPTVNYS